MNSISISYLTLIYENDLFLISHHAWLRVNNINLSQKDLDT